MSPQACEHKCVDKVAISRNLLTEKYVLLAISKCTETSCTETEKNNLPVSLEELQAFMVIIYLRSVSGYKDWELLYVCGGDNGDCCYIKIINRHFCSEIVKIKIW